MDLLKKYKNMLDNKKQHRYIKNKLEMTDHLTESKVVNVRCFSFLSIQVYETQLGFNAVVSNDNIICG